MNTNDAVEWYNRVGYIRQYTMIPNCVEPLFKEFKSYESP
jgi:hypothetical protein